ncbi:Ketoisovalerate reductase [Lachnellula occidentalis]|uniref:2-dehydropantoate 2-reductase n=1 Tax=Lachnellula occidentalis TaxID=215460 RepID=A0A8H8UJX1_9HELO|nr:Ketoisovalerate reductase [Lachnellula occidentalis]
MSSSPRIHILGVGNLGRLFAHALANTPNPPRLTLLLHRPSLLSEWDLAGRTISITTHSLTNSNGVYDIEEPITRGSIIENLIIATKTLHTAKALKAVKHRLGAQSTILFTQNGMGTTEEATRLIFPEEATRPSYLAAITSHGLYSEGPFRSVFAGQAHVSVGHVCGSSPKSQYLLDQIVNAKLLNATEFESRELRMLQLEKLVINAMINPLTVIYNCRNGELFKRSDVTSVMRDLLAEASQVISLLPELRTLEDGGNDVAERFSKEKLESKVLDVAEKTASNTSSMLQDFRAGRETEVGYINGYIVKRGKELGINVGNNDRIVEMVQKKKVVQEE